MADHPRSAFRRMSSNRLFVRLIVPEILRCIDFGVLAWNCLFTPLLEEFWGHISPTWHNLSPWPPKGPFLGGNTSFEPFSVNIGATVQPGRVTERNNTGQQKSHKSVIFPLFGGSHHWTDSTQKVAWWVTSTM